MFDKYRCQFCEETRNEADGYFLIGQKVTDMVRICPSCLLEYIYENTCINMDRKQFVRLIQEELLEWI